MQSLSEAFRSCPWKYLDGKYKYTLSSSDPEYPYFMYAFLRDPYFKSSFCRSYEGDDHYRIYSLTPGAGEPLPALITFVESLSPIHCGYAEIGDGRKVGLRLNAEETIKTNTGIMEMFFHDYYDEASDLPVMFSHEEKITIINRVHDNAKVFKAMTYGKNA